MALKIPIKLDIENFTIEDNILKGIIVETEENPNIGEAILNTLDSTPDHVAQIDAETDLKTTFAEMKDRSIRCALWMKEYGVKLGDIITICSYNHLDTYVPIFATFYLGATFNGWDHEVGLQAARHLMKLFEPKLIFVCESAIEVLLEAAKLENVKTEMIVFGNYRNINSLDDILKVQYSAKIRMFHPMRIENRDAISIILLTSGSTGAPKGVMHSYKNFLKLVQAFTVYPLKGVALCTSTVYWLTGIMYMFVSTFTKGTRITLKKWDVDEGCKAIQKYKVERMFMSPVIINYLRKLKAFNKYDLRSLENICTGGVKISQEILKDFQEQLPNAFIYQAYGSTETGRMVATQTEKIENLDSVGFVTSNTKIKIIDVDNHQILGQNQEGEICVKQPTLMLGYYKNPEETRNAIDEDGWLHTGDKGYFDHNGEIIVTDRLKNIIKCRNYQISPAELEEILSSHPAVLEVAVVPIPHEMDTEQPLAFVSVNAHVSKEELISLTLVLGENKKLRGGVEFVQELPKTPSGKINRAALKEMAKVLYNKRQLYATSEGVQLK
ncbi:luciferin 4-monooxygenase-like [Phymastichus coffea]|uniref:luciferin 4-monooxygenase-like n=1 Tax=Phymastichus coffea TaxID=108790 RepID=UPI00273BDCA3|nr:luciferin 4-monooxygenase-like [Phymastichus coffea]